MPTCQNCGNRWRWLEAMKSSFTLDQAMNCPYCGSRQFMTKRSRKRVAMMNGLILLPLLLNAFSDLPVYVPISLMLIISIVVFISMPYLMELSNENTSTMW